MKKTIFYYGIISGIVMILLFLIPFLVNGDIAVLGNGAIFGYASIILSLSAVYLGIRKYRDRYNNKVLLFGEGFGVGSEISGIAGIIFGVYSYLHYRTNGSEIAEQILNYYRNRIINSGASQELIAEQLKRLNEQSWYYGNPIVIAVVTLFTVFAIGLLISAISAFVLRRKANETLLKSPIV